jgi:hypothetical protein
MDLRSIPSEAGIRDFPELNYHPVAAEVNCFREFHHESQPGIHGETLVKQGRKPREIANSIHLIRNAAADQFREVPYSTRSRG